MIQLLLQLAVLGVVMFPLGAYMAHLYQGQATFLTPVLAAFERTVYGLAGIDPGKTMDWKTYALAALIFSALGFVALYGLLVMQAGLAPDTAFTVAAGFVTNAHVLPQDQMPAVTVFSRAAGLTVQNFLSAGVGMAAFAAVARGVAQRGGRAIGNFWVDLVRSLLYVLLPLSLIYAGLVSTAGVGEAVDLWVTAHSAHGGHVPAPGPGLVNGLVTHSGALLNADSAQIDALSSPLMRLVAFLSLTLIPAALCWSFAIMAGNRRMGAGLLALVVLLSLPGLIGGTSNPVAVFTSAFAGSYAVLLYGLVTVQVAMASFRGGVPLQPFEVAMAAVALIVPCVIGVICIALVGRGGRVAGFPYPALSVALLFGRFWVMIPALALAGSISSDSRSWETP